HLFLQLFAQSGQLCERRVRVEAGGFLFAWPRLEGLFALGGILASLSAIVLAALPVLPAITAAGILRAVALFLRAALAFLPAALLVAGLLAAVAAMAAASAMVVARSLEPLFTPKQNRLGCFGFGQLWLCRCCGLVDRGGCRRRGRTILALQGRLALGTAWGSIFDGSVTVASYRLHVHFSSGSGFAASIRTLCRRLLRRRGGSRGLVVGSLEREPFGVSGPCVGHPRCFSGPVRTAFLAGVFARLSRRRRSLYRGSLRCGGGLCGSVDLFQPGLDLAFRSGLGAIAKALENLLHVVRCGAQDRQHGGSHHEGLAVIGAVRAGSQARLPVDRRADQVCQTFQYIHAHGTAAKIAVARQPVEFLVEGLVDHHRRAPGGE